MKEWPNDIIPCLPRNQYTLGRDPAANHIGSFSGPSIERWVNDAPSFQVNATLDITHAQYAAFQSFIAAISHGSEWFLMDVDVGYGIQQHECHLREMYTSSLQPSQNWKVTLPLEVRMINVTP